MTVSYTNEIATTTAVGIFWKLLGRWKGSIYKLIWREVIIFSMLYYLIKLLYEFGLDDYHKGNFEEVVLYCRQYSTSIPLSFVLGFYVNLVMSRWWQQYKSLPWPDTFGIQVSSMVEGLDERSRMMRRTVMRYVNLSYVMALAIISPRVQMRFPSMEHIVEEGFIEPNENQIMQTLGKDVPHSLYWLPLLWATSILKRARKEGLIKDELSLKAMMDSIIDFRSGLASLLGFNSISIPLVYTQVVTLAVYSFFAGSLISSQYIGAKYDRTDMIIPWFALLQYLFYVGWLKVAETLVNPFGTDDDDFELNILIDRNFQVGYLIVDAMHDIYPELIQDKYWEDVMPKQPPVTPEMNRRSIKSQENLPSRFKEFLKETPSPFINRKRSASERTTLIRDSSNHGTCGSPQKLLEEGELHEYTKLPYVLPLNEKEAKKANYLDVPSNKSSGKGSRKDSKDGILFADDESLESY